MQITGQKKSALAVTRNPVFIALLQSSNYFFIVPVQPWPGSWWRLAELIDRQKANRLRLF